MNINAPTCFPSVKSKRFLEIKSINRKICSTIETSLDTYFIIFIDIVSDIRQNGFFREETRSQELVPAVLLDGRVLKKLFLERHKFLVGEMVDYVFSKVRNSSLILK